MRLSGLILGATILLSAHNALADTASADNMRTYNCTDVFAPPTNSLAKAFNESQIIDASNAAVAYAIHIRKFNRAEDGSYWSYALGSNIKFKVTTICEQI